GWLADHLPAGRVDLGAGLHRGILPADFAELIGRLEVDITVTPWQGVIFHDIADGDADVVLRVLAPRGFIFDVNSPLL
ncbi:MAG: precorrin-3B synthase, partial [Corynebacterium camporealensis]|nr:precorrin-3B synthase [Corynebacterium camporealensis]